MFYCKKKFRVLKQSLEEIENQGLLLYHQRLADLRSRLKFNRHDFDLVDGTFDGLTRHVALQGIRQRRRTKSERERVRRLQ